MKLTTTSATFALALITSINAAPTSYSDSTALSKRDVSNIESAIALLNEHKAKRDTIPVADLVARESEIVTKVLEYIKDTNLSPKIIKYFTTNSFFAPITKKTIIALVKNGTINIDTLFKSLNDSGLAASVIEDLINDCQLYAEIYKLALSYIGDLADKLKDKIEGKSDSSSSKREVQPALETRADDDNSVLTSLMESLKDSGLANQVVEALIVDKQFLSFGADLIKQLFEQKALTLGEVVDAIAQSGLVPSLFKQFFTLDTLKTVTVNALAAAFGKCGGSSATATSGGSTPTSATSTPTTTGGNNPVCKKRKRSYH